MSPIAQKTIAKAISQLGVEELPKGSNAGAAVEKYLASVGLGKGYAWCEAFVYWCTKTASVENGFKNPLSKTAGVLDQLEKSKKLKVTKPQAGDIFIMDFGSGLGHTGFVEKVSKDIVHTIEGNTNDDGSREGYKVCRRKRKTSTIKAFLRL